MTTEDRAAAGDAMRDASGGAASRARVAIVLAGGTSRRMPDGKPGALLGGRTLLERAVATVRAAGLTPVVCAREHVSLPEVEAPVWREPDGDPSSPHPLRGIAYALRAADAPAVILPVDLPLLPPSVLVALAATPAPLAVIAEGGRPAALIVRAAPAHAAALVAAADAGAPALRTLVELGATRIELASAAPGAAEHALLNVNDPATLAQAEALLAKPAAPDGKRS